MGKRPTIHDSVEVPRDTSRESTSLVFVATIADTTWRMFVPTVGTTLLGVWLDERLSTKPWLMFVGIAVGAAVAVALVVRQLRQLKKVRQ